jgi:predicted nucleotidyltransferase
VGFKVFFQGNLSGELKNLYGLFIEKIEQTISVPHRVAIVISDEVLLGLHTNILRKISKRKYNKMRLFYGEFAAPSYIRQCDRDNWDCIIRIAGRCHALKDSRYFEGIMTILHEVCHYLQFRNKKKLSERNIDRCSIHLLKRMKKKWGLRAFYRFAKRLKSLPVVRSKELERLKI